MSHFAGWTVPRVSLNIDNPLPDCQLHEHILHVQEHAGDTAAALPALRGAKRKQEQTYAQQEVQQDGGIKYQYHFPW